MRTRSSGANQDNFAALEFAAPAERSAPPRHAGTAEDRDRLRGLLVFVVEDEPLVALQLEDTLTRLGCHVLDLAHSFDDAAQALDAREFDIAILDINLGGKVVYPIARRLADRRVPFIFTTAYSTTHVREIWPDTPILNKPYAERDLVLAIVAGLRAAPGDRHTGA